MSSELIINASLPETRIALMEEGEIQELLIERASGKGIVGNIYKGKVTRVLPGMQAAFVDIGLDKAAFLYVDDIFVHPQMWQEEPESLKVLPKNVMHSAVNLSVHPDATPSSRDEAQGSSQDGLRQEEGRGELSEHPLLSEHSLSDALEGPSFSQGREEALISPKEALALSHASVSSRLIDDPENLGALEEAVDWGEQGLFDGEKTEETTTQLHFSLPEGTEGSLSATSTEVPTKNAQPVEVSHLPAPVSQEAAFFEDDSELLAESLSDDFQDDFLISFDSFLENTNLANSNDQLLFEESGMPAWSPSLLDEEHSGEFISEESAESTGLSQDEEFVSIDILQEEQGEGDQNQASLPQRKKYRRGRRGGKFKARSSTSPLILPVAQPSSQDEDLMFSNDLRHEDAGFSSLGDNAQNQYPLFPDSYHQQMADSDFFSSDRSLLIEEGTKLEDQKLDNEKARPLAPLPDPILPLTAEQKMLSVQDQAQFKAHRSKDRRIRARVIQKSTRAPVNIQDLLKEGQEVLVQVAKDPISTKGARLTCHISLPGRHLVCMPTIDHVGVSRRIERDEERRRLREYVEKNRPKNLGFIVRTASGKQQSEKRIKQDIEYLMKLWSEIRDKATSTKAPALVYEDLNVVLRAIRDWINEDTDKILVDSKQHYHEIQRFVSHFMPFLKHKVELYHGDVPIFDAYGISTETSRALERKVWLKSGGSIIIDQAEALVAIDVNTGRYVGKKNLEDTILKTNLEAVKEIAYQLRLRNCGGIIILDLIDMEKEENKQRVYRALEEELQKDRARPTIMKISDLGLIEMTRKRTRDTIIRTLCESCSHCEGKGFIKNKQSVAYEVMREIEREGIEGDMHKILVQAHPEVIDILAIDERETLDQLERRYRKTIFLQAVSNFHQEQFEVTAEKRTEQLLERGSLKGLEHSKASADRSFERGFHSERNRTSQGYSYNNNNHNHHKEGREAQRKDTHALSPVREAGKAQMIIKSPKKIPMIKVGPVARNNALSQKTVSDPQENFLEPLSESKKAHTEEAYSDGASTDVLQEAVNSTLQPTIPKGFEVVENFEEEDRLAFLRAQAAQDAALARINGGGNAVSHSGSHLSRSMHNDSAGLARGTTGHPPRRNSKHRRPQSTAVGGVAAGGKFRRPPHANRTSNKPYSPGSQKALSLPLSPSDTPHSNAPQSFESDGEKRQATPSDSQKPKNGGHSQPPV